jgi:hypothetical protein
MVLDAGMKKSTEGKNIPKCQKERPEARYKKAREYRPTPQVGYAMNTRP